MDDHTPPAARASLRTGVLLFLATAVLYIGTAGYDRHHIDVVSANVGAWRIATTGAPWVDDLDVQSMSNAEAPLWTGEGAGGHTVMTRQPGAVAASIPAYFIWSRTTDGGTAERDFSNGPAAVTAAVLSALAVLLMWLAVLPLVGRTAATLTAGVLAFATPMWSVAADGMWTHTVTVLGIAGLAWAASRERWWLVGLFGGVAVWGRLHTVLIAAAVALVCAHARRSPRIALVVAAGGAALTGLASLWTRWIHGGWMPAGGASPAAYLGRAGETDHTASATGLLVNELGLWVAPDRGLLVWTPLALVLLPALVRSWRDQPLWARAMLVGGLAYLFLQGWLNVFDGGDGVYGHRLGLELLACATPCFAYAARACGPVARRLLAPVIGLQLAAFALGGILNRPTLTLEHVWTDNAFVHAVRTLPLLAVPVVAVIAAVVLVDRTWLRERAGVGGRP